MISISTFALGLINLSDDLKKVKLANPPEEGNLLLLTNDLEMFFSANLRPLLELHEKGGIALLSSAAKTSETTSETLAVFCYFAVLVSVQLTTAT